MFSVTIIKSFSIEVHPISKSKSLIIIPFFLNLDFSLPYKFIASKIGSITILLQNYFMIFTWIVTMLGTIYQFS